jgi:hypothetical protein
VQQTVVDRMLLVFPPDGIWLELTPENHLLVKPLLLTAANSDALALFVGEPGNSAYLLSVDPGVLPVLDDQAPVRVRLDQTNVHLGVGALLGDRAARDEFTALSRYNRELLRLHEVTHLLPPTPTWDPSTDGLEVEPDGRRCYPDEPFDRVETEHACVNGPVHHRAIGDHLNRHLVLPDDLRPGHYYQVDQLAKKKDLRGRWVRVLGVKWGPPGVDGGRHLAWRCEDLQGRELFQRYIDGTTGTLHPLASEDDCRRELGAMGDRLHEMALG